MSEESSVRSFEGDETSVSEESSVLSFERDDIQIHIRPVCDETSLIILDSGADFSCLPMHMDAMVRE